MHGITKMQEYMTQFGNGINFYGGPGGSAHKQFLNTRTENTAKSQ